MKINSQVDHAEVGERSEIERQVEAVDATEPEMCDFALADLSLWIRHGLERLKGRTVYEHGDHGAAVNAYAYAEFPDWDLRQKLDLIESAKQDASGLVAALEAISALKDKMLLDPEERDDKIYGEGANAAFGQAAHIADAALSLVSKPVTKSA